MKLHGKNIIGGEESGGGQTFSAFDPARGEQLAPPFAEATAGEIDRALELAERAFHDYRRRPAGEIADFLDRIAAEIADLGDELIYPGILRGYEAGLERLSRIAGVSVARAQAAPDAAKTEAGAAVLTTDAPTFLRHRELGEEVFGPSTVVASCGSRAELEEVARAPDGHLTATIHGTGEDLAEFRGLVALLEDKVGRLIFNGFPTGVEVSPAMHHGGPYPATTDVHFTSVGTAAIQHFARPVCYQNFPPEALPAELQNINRRRIWRLVDNN